MTTKLLGAPLEYFLHTTLVKVVAEVTLQTNMTSCPNCALYVNAGKMMLGRPKDGAKIKKRNNDAIIKHHLLIYTYCNSKKKKSRGLAKEN